MKILLYFESESLIQTSGVGRAFEHQKAALTSQGIAYTTDPWDEDYDILHINTCGLNSDAIIAHARRLGKKVVYHAHSTEEDFRNSFIFSNLLSPIVKHSLISLYSKGDAIITPTPYSRSLLQGYGIKKPIYAVSNGIDLSQFAPSSEKVKAFRNYFRIQEGDKVILSVGLPFERKGILDFVKVADRLPEYRFIWFGEISPLAVPQKINEVIEHHPDNCLFPGYVKGPIIQGAFQDSTAFFFPSYEETEGIVVLEALASRQQVIVRDIGAFDPWLKNGENCYKGNNNDEFVSLIRDCAEHRIPHTGDAGYKVAEQRSIETIGKQLKRIYEAVLNGEILRDEEIPVL